jgi:hypothetical protein
MQVDNWDSYYDDIFREFELNHVYGGIKKRYSSIHDGGEDECLDD